MLRSLFPSLQSRSARCPTARRRATRNRLSGLPSLVETLEARVVLSGVTALVADINPGSAASFPSNFTALDGHLYFGADNGVTGEELWRHDPATGTTALVADINLGSASSGPAWLAVLDGQLYFAASNGVTGAELWRHDPATGTTELVADINPGSASSEPAWLTALNGHLYFGVLNGGLWHHDPASGTTALVADASIINPGSLAVLDGQLYFGASHGKTGTELWRHDPATGTTALVADINLGSASSEPHRLKAHGGQLYFSASNGKTGAELWRHDPATGTTALVADINPGSAGSFLSKLTALDGQLYFGANDGVTGLRMWHHNPATGITALVAKGNIVDPSSLAVLDNQLYFGASGGVTGAELWRHDPATGTTELVADISPGGSGSQPANLTAFNGQLYFMASDGVAGHELWHHDPTSPPVSDPGGPYTVVVGQSVTLDGSASTDDAVASLAYAWDLDNDGVFGEAGELGVNPSFSAVGLGAGAYAVSLRVTDADGLASTAATTVTVLQPPTAVAGGPYTVVVGQSVTLDGSASTDDAVASLAYAWDLDNDGVFGEAGELGVNPSFSAVGLGAGAYAVSLRVTDADGLASTAATTVNVITAVEFTNNVIVAVSQEITDLNTSGLLTTTTTNTLMAKLDAAKAALERDNTTAAANQITAVIFQLEGMVRARKLTVDAADDLTSDLEAALALL